MSIAEMKLAIFEEVNKINDEKALNEVLSHLAAISQNKNSGSFDLAQHYDSIKDQYGKVLEKLAK